MSNDGTVIYAIGDIGPLYAVDAWTGEVLWTVDLPEDGFVVGLALGPDGTIYVTTSVLEINPRLQAISASGEVKWTLQLFSGAPGPPAVDSNGVIYVGRTGQFMAINPDGSLKWVLSEGTDETPVIAGPGLILLGGLAFGEAD